MNTIRFYNGVKMPALGFGTFKVTDPEVCRKSVYDALKAGYRLIDTAQCYGNEESVGDGILDAIKDGIVTREEVFLTTKVWFKAFETEECEAGLKESFRKLKTEYIDLVLIHWPYGNVYAAWRVLEKYYEAGKIRAIGVSNMEADRLIDMINFNKVKPMLNQIETNLYCQRIEERKWLDKYEIAHQSYGPLGQGRANEMFREPIVMGIAEKYGKTPAQVLLRFMLQLGISVIPKSVREERIRENCDVFDFELSEAEIAALRTLDRADPKVGKAEDPLCVEEAMGW